MKLKAALGRLLKIISILLVVPVLSGADWPQWLGPARNGSSPETGLLTDWPKEGPKVLWKVPGGDGYSSVAVAGGRAITLVQRGTDELVIALDAVSGKELWTARCGPAYKNKYGNGPRSTPACEGKLVYVQSVTGPLMCLEADSGKIVWQHHLLKEFGAKNLTWGLSASPLIEGDLVLALPGAPGAGVAAFHKKDGRLAWKTGDDKAAYASPVAVTVGGSRQLIFFTAAGLLAVAPDRGAEFWRIPWTTEFDCNIATPLVIGDRLFVSSGEENGCALYKLAAAGSPEPIWESKGKKSVMINYWATSVMHNGFLFGLAGEFDKSINLNCVDLKTGKLVWSHKDFGKAAVTLAAGHLILVTKKGDLVLAPATPQGYEEKARVRLLAETRTAATVSSGRLYLRDRENIFCLDITKR
jgi:outer membrane protein assembly factor BamB